ncbi:hypothetical protein K474DRAFT_1674049 [Panus rudis PR-1116 ss-1]|nr:hypothetical protein K474DRAFT_1674049 [Panus rudis PR-1116 ss-1]
MSTPTIVDPRTKSWKIRRKKVINAWEVEKELIEAKEEQWEREEAERRARKEQKRREEKEVQRKTEEEVRKKAEEEARKRAEEKRLGRTLGGQRRARRAKEADKGKGKAREDVRRAKEAKKGKRKAMTPSEVLEAEPSGSWVPGFKTPCYNYLKKDYDCIQGILRTEKGKPSKACINCLEFKIQCSRDPTMGLSRKAHRKTVDPDYIDIDEDEDDKGEVPRKKKTTSKIASKATRRPVGGDFGPQIEQLTATLE